MIKETEHYTLDLECEACKIGMTVLPDSAQEYEFRKAHADCGKPKPEPEWPDEMWAGRADNALIYQLHESVVDGWENTERYIRAEPAEKRITELEQQLHKLQGELGHREADLAEAKDDLIVAMSERNALAARQPIDVDKATAAVHSLQPPHGCDVRLSYAAIRAAIAGAVGQEAPSHGDKLLELVRAGWRPGYVISHEAWTMGSLKNEVQYGDELTQAIDAAWAIHKGGDHAE